MATALLAFGILVAIHACVIMNAFHVAVYKSLDISDLSEKGEKRLCSW